MIYDLSFNICFIGTYSFTCQFCQLLSYHFPVLILVLLELILLLELQKATSMDETVF